MMSRSCLALLVLAGCDVFALPDDDPPEPVITPDASPGVPDAPPPLPDAAEVPASPRPGFIVAPRNGDVVSGSLTEAGLQLRGYTSTPSTVVRLQVLQYGAELTLPARYATFATVTSSATPLAGTEGAPLYPWFSSASPVTDRTWAVGGVLRLRVLDPEERALITLDADVEPCLAAATGGLADKLAACRSVFPELGVVHSGGAPEDRTRFLDLEGLGNASETAAYYAAIDAPATLADFRTRFGFAGGDVEAVYYNAGDLGIGREMHCRAFAVAGQVAPGVACWVSNYGEFGGPRQAAIDGAVSRTGAFATVAMVYRPPIGAPDSVQFMVYGAGGALATSAPLDTHGDNPSIPQNCLNCHGAQASYDTTLHRVVGGARFLPFDPAAFVFPDVANLRRADQEEELRQLNALVDRAGATAATRELIAAFYGGPGKVDVAATRADEQAIPAGWSQTAADRKIYQTVIRPYCRACHVAQEPLAGRAPIDFGSAAAFRSLTPAIQTRVCGPHLATNLRMPSAEIPLGPFWRGSARASLVGYLGMQGLCLP